MNVSTEQDTTGLEGLRGPQDESFDRAIQSSSLLAIVGFLRDVVDDLFIDNDLSVERVSRELARRLARRGMSIPEARQAEIDSLIEKKVSALMIHEEVGSDVGPEPEPEEEPQEEPQDELQEEEPEFSVVEMVSPLRVESPQAAIAGQSVTMKLPMPVPITISNDSKRAIFSYASFAAIVRGAILHGDGYLDSEVPEMEATFDSIAFMFEQNIMEILGASPEGQAAIVEAMEEYFETGDPAGEAARNFLMCCGEHIAREYLGSSDVVFRKGMEALVKTSWRGDVQDFAKLSEEICAQFAVYHRGAELANEVKASTSESESVVRPPRRKRGSTRVAAAVERGIRDLNEREPEIITQEELVERNYKDLFAGAVRTFGNWREAVISILGEGVYGKPNS